MLKGATDIIQLLLENGANLSVVDNLNRSVLECAVLHNKTASVILLLNNNVNVNTKCKNGGTCLHRVNIFQILPKKKWN